MKNAFILYTDYRDRLQGLSHEQMGELFGAILDYENDVQPEITDPVVQFAFGFISVDLDKNKAAYEDTCRKRSESGKQGGRPKTNALEEKQTKAKKANAFSEKQTKAKKADSDSDSDSDSVSPYGDNIYTAVIGHLNERAGTNYSPKTKATKRLIDARVREGYSLEDFKKVIDIKSDEWKGTDMAKYLRPETLFSNKFEGYLNQPRARNGGRRMQEFDERTYESGEMEDIVPNALDALMAMDESEWDEYLQQKTT